LLANQAPADEIAATLRGQEALVRVALAGWREEAIALCDVDDALTDRWVAEQIGGFMALTMGRCTDEARQEFSDQCALEFAQIPLAMLTDVVRLARREVTHPERFVPYVFDKLSTRLPKFEAEGQRLERLAEIADA
jgi:hypothetical protein